MKKDWQAARDRRNRRPAQAPLPYLRAPQLRNRRLMQIAVISDLHLGRCDSADVFRHDDTEFVRFLKFLEHNFERVVLLGDIWETLTMRSPAAPRTALKAAREAHPEIARRFEGKQYQYLHGNHDFIAGAAQGVPDEYVLDADGVRVLFTHGHHHDLLIRKARWLTEAAVWFGGWLDRIRLHRFVDVLRYVDIKIGGVREDASRCSFQRWALEAAKIRDADIVVTGHTHRPTVAEHSEHIFMNSGSCSRGEHNFLSLDTKAGAYALNSNWKR